MRLFEFYIDLDIEFTLLWIIKKEKTNGSSDVPSVISEKVINTKNVHYANILYCYKNTKLYVII